MLYVDICLFMTYIGLMWTVKHHLKVEKSLKNLPKEILRKYVALLEEIEQFGPYRHNWKNYGKLEHNKFHCHIQKGKPTYIACWEIVDKTIKITEVYYVGTHEKAPY